MTTENKIRRISEYCGEIRTIVGIRNLMTDAVDKLQIVFGEKLISEYPSSHTLVDTRKIKETIKILLAVRAATTSSMSDR
jgi:hypothetical protein